MSTLEGIYSTYFSDVYRYARSLTLDEHLAGDITEETFFRAMRSFSSFRGDCEIRVWLCRIAKNIWIDEQKKRKRFTDDEEALEAVPDEDDSVNEEGADDKQATLKIHRILHKIEEPYKEVFSLRVFGELSFHDIGELFGKNEHWACVTYHRAKEKIQKEMIQS